MKQNEGDRTMTIKEIKDSVNYYEGSYSEYKKVSQRGGTVCCCATCKHTFLLGNSYRSCLVLKNMCNGMNIPTSPYADCDRYEE